MRNSYPVLITDAFVLHTRGTGEASRNITMLTRSNGLVLVYARSIRKEGAKMRGTTLPYGRVSVSVVRGKHNILKDARVVDTLAMIWSNEAKYTAFVCFLRYVRTVIPVVEFRDDAPFAIAEMVVFFLKKTQPIHAEHVSLVGQVMLLGALGYSTAYQITRAQFEYLLASATSSAEICNEFRQHLQHALRYQ